MATTTTASIIRFQNALVSQRDKEWTVIASSVEATDEEKAAVKESKNRLQEHLKALLTNYNVIVLAGSGSSIDAVAAGVGGPKMSELWDTIVTWDGFEDVKTAVRYNGLNNIEDFLSQCHNSLAFLEAASSGIVSEFIKKAEREIFQQCTEFLTGCPPLPSHEEFLDRLTKRKSRFPRPKVFTTNYDLCFECAAARRGLTIIDGFSYSQPRKFNPNFFGYDIVRRAKSPSESNELVEGVLQLFKIHGSVDWEINGSGILQTPNPHEDKRCLIYPAATKYQHSYTQPYLEMMARFLMSVREPNTTLIVVGFGFNDSHLNAPILAAIQSNPSLSLIVVDPSIEDKADDLIGYAPHIEISRYTSSRATLLNATFGQFTALIPDLKGLGWDQNEQ